MNKLILMTFIIIVYLMLLIIVFKIFPKKIKLILNGLLEYACS